MPSILEETPLTIDNFEGAIAVGLNQREILTMFAMKKWEMDEWCKQNYKGRDFDAVFSIVKQLTYAKYLEVVKGLGYRGNASALNIINNVLNERAQNNGIVKIVFDSAEMKKENDDDKKCD